MRYKEHMAPPASSPQGLTVAVTGPTGEIGQAVVAALERSREVIAREAVEVGDACAARELRCRCGDAGCVGRDDLR